MYVWDEADRLVDVHKGGEVVMMCRYDGLSRRRERVMNGITNRYVYHDAAVGGAGWLVVEVRDGANDVLETYTHGPDLSGSLGGAGGIGGILAVTHTGATNATYFYHYDANGNVVQLTDTNGAVVSTLDYTPFGHVLASTGRYTPRYQFSTKEYDEVVGVNYYGYRFHNPSLGRWLSRDPYWEIAFVEHIQADVVRSERLMTDDNLYAASLFGCCPEYLGLGILCVCPVVGYLPPIAALPPGASVDGVACTANVRGVERIQTIATSCGRTVLGEWLCANCKERQCGYKIKWRCIPPRWVYNGEEKFDDC